MLPSVLIERSVLDRSHAVLPVVTGSQISSFHDASSRKAEQARIQIIKSLGEILSQSVLMAHPGVDRKQGYMFHIN